MVDYSDSPPVHLFADSAAALERVRRTAELALCRIVSAALVGPGRAAGGGCAGGAALIELDGEAGEGELVALLDWAEAEAEAGRRQAMVSSPPALIDLVAARTPHCAIVQLCAASAGERVAAAALASRRAPARLSDIGREDGSLILRQLSEDVGRVAAILASLSEGRSGAAAGGGAAGAGRLEEGGLDPAFIRAMLRARRLRGQFFRGDLFADPAWDMLLDLMAARLEGKRVAVSSLCIAAAVPATTALRWIKALTDRGLFVREADPKDGRRVHIALSDEAARALAAYLRTIQRMAPTAI